MKLNRTFVSTITEKNIRVLQLKITRQQNLLQNLKIP